MKISKRILALVGGGVAVAVLGGAINGGAHVGSALADGPYQAGLGCIPSAAGSVTGLTFSGAVQPGVPAGPNLVQNGFGVATTLTGANSFILTAPVSLTCDVALINGTTASSTEDSDQTTVDGGTISYVLNSGVGGRFVLTGQNGALNGSFNCGSSTTPTGIASTVTGATLTIPAGTTNPPGAPATYTAGTPGPITFSNPGGLESCKGALSVAGTLVTPNQANAVSVGLAPGIALTSFGNIGGSLLGTGGLSLTATYTRYASLNGPFTATPTSTVAFPAGTSALPANCTLLTGTLASAAPAPGGTAGTAGTASCTQAAVTGTTTPGASSVTLTQPIAFVAPSYYVGLSANPTTISANPTLNTSNPGVASTGNGGGSLITATHYTVSTVGAFTLTTTGGTPVIIPASGGIATASGSFLYTGTEPGQDTFVTNNGIFGTPSSAAASAQQTVSVACGVLPGTSNLFFNPALFSFGTFSFSSCTTDSVTLYGGGAAGQATVVDTFTGSITGAQAQNAVIVGFSPVSNTAALPRGCDEYITVTTIAASTPIATIVSSVTPSSAVVSIWQYNNATQSFNALYFSTAGAPTNGNAVGPGQSIFICVNGPATIGNGAF